MAKKKATFNLGTGEVTGNFDVQSALKGVSNTNPILDISRSREGLSHIERDTLHRLQGGEKPTHNYHMGMGYVFCLMDKNREKPQEQRDNEARIAIAHFVEFYGRCVPTFDCRGLKSKRSDDIYEHARVACRKVKKYFETNGVTEISWKTILKESIVCYTLELADTPDGEKNTFRLIVHDVFTASNDYLNSFSFLLSTTKGTITPMMYGVTGKDRKESMRGISALTGNPNKLVDLFMNLVYYSTESIRMITSSNKDRYKTIYQERFEHTDGEIYFMKRFLKEFQPAPVVRPVIPYDWSPEDFQCRTKIYYEDPNEKMRQRPHIELTNTEWGTVRDYVLKEYPESTPTPMHRILNHLPYGEYLMINYPILLKNKNIPLKVNIVANDESIDENGMIREGESVDITAWYVHDENYQYVVRFTIDELTDDFGVSSFCDIVLSAPLIMHNKLVATEKELLNMFPDEVVDLFTKQEYVQRLCSDILDLIVTMHDRPERFVQIEEQTRKSLPRNRNGKPSRKDKEYTTRFIVKTVYQGRKYVKQNTDGNTIRRYVMEHWKRRGHWRTLTSGKQVWIGEVECKRHLEMSETPVVINYEERISKKCKVV